MFFFFFLLQIKPFPMASGSFFHPRRLSYRPAQNHHNYRVHLWGKGSKRDKERKSVYVCKNFKRFFVVHKGLNTKQLTNQMLELTKVINELKDVLIQQVKPFCPLSFLPLCLMFLISTIPYLQPRFFVFAHACLQVKETSFLRNTISECQACGKILQ